MTSTASSPTLLARGEWIGLAGFLGRDLKVFIAGWFEFILRSITQPLLFLFVFTYVLPKVGIPLRAPSGITFKTVLVPGLIGYAAFYAGIYTISRDMSLELAFGAGGMEDRLLAPVPTWFVGLGKALAGGVQAICAAALVLILALVIPAARPTFSLAPPQIVVAAVLVVALLAAGTGLFVGTLIRPDRLAMLFTILLIPFAFLGCIYYSWESLTALKWLQGVVLINPLTYTNETARVALTNSAPHMAGLLALGGGAALGLLLLVVGLHRFVNQVLK